MSAPVAADPARSSSVWRREDWLTQPRVNLVSGLVVALALIPEAISFSIIAGVDPKVGLYASFSIAIIISFTGGRPGMISAATGAMALVVVSLVADYSDTPERALGYLFTATIMAGFIQMVFGYMRVGVLMRFVPRTVMLGFVNALAILIFLAQVPHILLNEEGDPTDQRLLNLVFIGAGLGVIYLLPRITKAVPSPLIAIAVITAVAYFMNLELPTVGDMGELPSALPWVALPEVPFNFETLQIVFPYAFTLALVGLLESLLTAQMLDDMTDTDSDKNMEARGQGIANVATGFLGGMAGCAMIGQSMINHASGGRTRLSTLASGAFLLVLILVFGDVVAVIPMAALVAVMIMVSIGTFNWRSVGPDALKSIPRTETTVMVVTVAVVVLTHNLAFGVGAGILMSAIFFVRHVSHVANVTSVVDPETKERHYTVTGELFFASTNDLVHQFDFNHVKAKRVDIDLTGARIWDTSAVAALDAVVAKFADRGIEAEVIGLNRHAERLHSRATGKVSTH